MYMQKEIRPVHTTLGAHGPDRYIFTLPHSSSQTDLRCGHFGYQ